MNHMFIHIISQIRYLLGSFFDFIGSLFDSVLGAVDQLVFFLILFGFLHRRHSSFFGFFDDMMLHGKKCHKLMMIVSARI